MNICCIDIIAAHYRAEVFSRMCKELSCDFYFGQPFGSISGIKSLPLSFFSTRAEYLKNVSLRFCHGYWQKGAISLLRRNYSAYIVSGDVNCVSTWGLMIANRLFFHKKVILWGHGWYGRESFPKKVIKKFYYALSDRILVYGDRAKKLMENEGIDSRKIYAVHNSLDYETQQDIIDRITSDNPIREHFRNDCPCIVFSGRLTPSKRIDMILDVLSQLKKEKIIVNCVLIGDGQERQKLESIVAENNLTEQVWFYGACYDESSIGSLYWNANLCVSPGNVGLTAIHALTYGCPVVTHNNFPCQMPEFEAIVPGKTGDFYEYDDSSSFKETINKWIHLSLQNKSSIQKACRETVKAGWTPEYQINVIKECCAN
jgi:glycosyltransferase involved in cell wall biosynthesis